MIIFYKKLNIALIIALFLTSICFGANTTDIGIVGIGARPISLGGSFVGIADDANAIFLNPAGLTRINGWQITSMQTTLLTQVNYRLLGISYPTNFGAFGIGYLGASSPAGMLTTRDAQGNNIVLGGPINYDSSVYTLSYAKKIKSSFPDLSVGGNVKIYSQGFSNIGEEAKGQGYGIDLALLIKPKDNLNFGLVGKNIVSSGVIWTSGTNDRIVNITKAGLQWNIRQNLSLSGDVDLNYYMPAIYHAGIEWTPVQFLMMRAGLDQNAAATGNGGISVISNMTGGIGLRLGIFRFDYAYHQDNTLSENNTHYFSLSISEPPRKLKEIISINQPDKIITYDSKVILNGSIDTSVVNDIRMNISNSLSIEEDKFSINAYLKPARNELVIEALDKNGSVLASKEVVVIRLFRFPDVPYDHFACESIEYLATLGIINGYPDGTFRAQGVVTRAQLAATTLKAMDKKLSTTKTMFRDVSKYYWASGYIDYAQKNKLVNGYEDKTFKPNNKVTRIEGLKIITMCGQITPVSSFEAAYADLNSSHWASSFVMSAKIAGMLDYISGNKLQPKLIMTRGAAAYSIAKISYVKQKIDEMLR